MRVWLYLRATPDDKDHVGHLVTFAWDFLQDAFGANDKIDDFLESFIEQDLIVVRRNARMVKSSDAQELNVSRAAINCLALISSSSSFRRDPSMRTRPRKEEFLAMFCLISSGLIFLSKLPMTLPIWMELDPSEAPNRSLTIFQDFITWPQDQIVND